MLRNNGNRRGADEAAIAKTRRPFGRRTAPKGLGPDPVGSVVQPRDAAVYKREVWVLKSEQLCVNRDRPPAEAAMRPRILHGRVRI